MADLFSRSGDRRRKKAAPLAEQMRPQTLDEILGQDHLLGPGKLLRDLAAARSASSLIFWGPPGSGKTTVAMVLAREIDADVIPLSAVLSGVKDVREAVDRAREAWDLHGRRTVLFIDEIHRFNKAQQDALLPHVENGTIVLFGATTENPSFEVISPLLSRCRVITLSALGDGSVRSLVERALRDEERGLGALGIDMTPAAFDFVVNAARGDARSALGTLEMATEIARKHHAREIDVAIAEEAAQQKWLRYDRAGEEHYNVVSAFIKSLRDSDADGALYWCMRMIEAGEDPLFVVRRMVIFAAEDVGNADPQALVVANGIKDAIHFVGLPEGKIPLAMGVTYLATAPKSNASYAAMRKALADVEEYGALPVPLVVRNAPTPPMKDLGYGREYRYVHDDPEGAASQQHRPEEVEGRRYYEPKDVGYEREIRERWRERGDDGSPSPDPPGRPLPKGERR